MAVLTDGDRKVIWGGYMSEISSNREACPILKADLRTVVNDIDTWINDNQASFNSAISEPGKSALTQKQKARVLLYIVQKRWEVT